MHDGDAMRHGGVGAVKVHFVAVNFNPARVGLVHTAQQFDQRALARPIFSDQRMNFTFFEIEIHMLQGEHARKALTDPFHPKKRRATHKADVGSDGCDRVSSYLETSALYFST